MTSGFGQTTVESFGQKSKDGVSKKLLEEGETHTEVVYFNSKWCADYLALSGDENIHLHDVNGEWSLVQGVGVLTKTSGPFSRSMPGWGLLRIDNIAFTRPVIIGDSVEISITRLDGNTAITSLQAILLLEGKAILEATVTLGSPKVVERLIRQRRV